MTDCTRIKSIVLIIHAGLTAAALAAFCIIMLDPKATNDVALDVFTNGSNIISIATLGILIAVAQAVAVTLYHTHGGQGQGRRLPTLRGEVSALGWLLMLGIILVITGIVNGGVENLTSLPWVWHKALVVALFVVMFYSMLSVGRVVVWLVVEVLLVIKMKQKEYRES